MVKFQDQFKLIINTLDEIYLIQNHPISSIEDRIKQLEDYFSIIIDNVLECFDQFISILKSKLVVKFLHSKNFKKKGTIKAFCLNNAFFKAARKADLKIYDKLTLFEVLFY